VAAATPELINNHEAQEYKIIEKIKKAMNAMPTLAMCIL